MFLLLFPKKMLSSLCFETSIELPFNKYKSNSTKTEFRMKFKTTIKESKRRKLVEVQENGSDLLVLNFH
jgi:hypothetical protein